MLPFYRGRTRLKKAQGQNMQLGVRRSKLCGTPSTWKHVTLRQDFLHWEEGSKLFCRQVTNAYKRSGALYLLYDLKRDKHSLVTESYGGRNLSSLLIQGDVVTNQTTTDSIQRSFFNVQTSVSGKTS